jgi:L-lactate permease
LAKASRQHIAAAGMTDDENQFVAAAAAHAPELIVKEGEDLDYPVLYIYIYIYIYIIFMYVYIYTHT